MSSNLIGAGVNNLSYCGPAQFCPDDWIHKSDAEKRWLAVESIAMRVAGSNANLDELLALTQKLVDFINGPQPASVQSPSAGLSAGLHSSETPDLPPRVTSEFLEQSA